MCIRDSSNVKRLLAKNPSPFTFYGTGTYIIGHDDLAIIDPGPLIESHIFNLLKLLKSAKKVSLFITHTHADHSPAARVIKDNIDCTSYGYGPYKRKKFDTNFEEGHDLTFKPDIYLNDGELVNGNGWTIRAIHTPGHTSNHLCYSLEEEKALFTGDHVMGWSTSIVSPPDGDMTDYMTSLKLLLERDDERYWPTHGTCIDNVDEYVHSFIDHRLQREHQILRCLNDGLQNIAEMVPVMYADTDKALYPAAARSVLAAMVRLVDTGQVRCDGVVSPDATYSLPA